MKRSLNNPLPGGPKHGSAGLIRGAFCGGWVGLAQNPSILGAGPPSSKTPIFDVIGKDFTFAPTTRQKKLCQAWMKGQQEQNSTPGKASSAVQNMQNENSSIHARTDS